jgi:trans-2-enoyl-CoA reductase
MYNKHGNCGEVIKVQTIPLPALGPQDVMIKMLAAPINPADLTIIEGGYDRSPPLPAVGGNEGVGEVIALGTEVTDKKVGDWVIPAHNLFGTWRSHAVCPSNALDVVTAGVPVHLAATVAVNSCTAYRLLQDFVTVKPGDVVVQNGGNSNVGLNVIQLCKRMGVKTASLIRNRGDAKELEAKLKAIGADIVMTDENMEKFKEAVSKLGRPVLGLNSVGGNTSLHITRMLVDGGVLVTFGGMSLRPVQIPTGRLIFNDISMRGFWLTRWNETHSRAERVAMVNTLLDIMKAGELVPWIEQIPFSKFDSAIREAAVPFRNTKVVMTF